MAGREAHDSVSQVVVPGERLARWVQNFTDRHGQTSLSVDDALCGTAADGSTFRAELPFGRRYNGPPDAARFLGEADPPAEWGVLLVRKGGFAVARLRALAITESKVGQRHVQGRTKAGGQSQQRFARRRDNQARIAYEAAADHAARIIGRVPLLVTGGDHAAVEAVLADPRLVGLAVVPTWLAVPDPRRSVLDQAVIDAASLRVEVTNSSEPAPAPRSTPSRPSAS